MPAISHNLKLPSSLSNSRLRQNVTPSTPLQSTFLSFTPPPPFLLLYKTAILRVSLVLLRRVYHLKMFRHSLRAVARSNASASWRPTAVRAFASAPKTTFDWEDPLASKNLLTEEELAIADTAERYCQERMMPRVLRMFPPSFPGCEVCN
jgi:glutaryl-CoA dehydrogenase